MFTGLWMYAAVSSCYCARLWSTQMIFILSQATSGAFFMDPVPDALSLNVTLDSVNCQTCMKATAHMYSQQWRMGGLHVTQDLAVSICKLSPTAHSNNTGEHTMLHLSTLLL